MVLAGDSFLSVGGFQKLPLLRQVEVAECGLACIGMVASFHGYKTNLASLRREHPISTKGATLADLVEIASSLELGSRSIRCELSELRNLRTPAILHWNMNHFVVLKYADTRRVVVHDPARGRLSCTLESISGNFTGVALELSPTPHFQRRRERSSVRLDSLMRFETTTWKALSQGLVLSLLLQIFVLAGPFFMQLVIDEAILKGDVSLLAAIAIGFALLKVFEVTTAVFRSLVFQFVSNLMTFDMKARLFHHLLRLPLSYFHRRHVGDIQQRFQSLQPICDLVVSGVISAVIDGVLALSIGVFLFAYDPTLAMIVMGAIALYTLFRFSFLEFSKRLAGDLLVAQAKESTRFLETLRAIQAIKVAGMETSREGLWRNHAADSINAGFRAGNVSIGWSAVSQLILGISTILVVYVAATATIAGQMTVGMVTSFLAYKVQLEQRLTALVEQWISWRLLEVHLERVSDIALHDKEPGTDAPILDRRLNGRVELFDVRFRYAPLEPEILRGVRLTIQLGEFIAIAGPSGSGKSTLLKVLAGLYQPISGSVHYDGLPLHSWGPRAIRDQIGMVMQDDTLVAGSIAENISFFDESANMDRIVEAAKLACIHDEIERMPMGYRSLVGDMGSSLSGGQQQRVILARALYRRPRLLVMDEGTAHLDVPIERQINEKLKALNITRIVVAHRPDTIRAADRVVVLAEGAIVSDVSRIAHNEVGATPRSASTESIRGTDIPKN